MRRDVLDLMAEEIGQRQADPLASFTSWEDGRRKLDGMSRGKRWDIDREQRTFEKEGQYAFERELDATARVLAHLALNSSAGVTWLGLHFAP